jgi:uncharacterized membrane protein HdeD (DUF308 family)
VDVPTRPSTRYEEVVETARSWWTLRGVIEVLAGVVALAMPLAATLTTTVVLAAVVGIAGIARMMHAARVRTWSGFFVDFVLAVLYLVAGAITFTYPVAGSMTLTLLLGAWCIAVGVLEVVGALAVRPPSWGWLVASGIASGVLGVLLIRGWPATSLWAIGVLVGATLVVNGASSLAIGLAPRHPVARPPHPAV